MSNQDIVRRWVAATQKLDWEGMRDLVHRDIVSFYPQSGERFVGYDNYVGMLQSFPDNPLAEIDSVHHDEKTMATASSTPFGAPVITVIGAGNTFVAEGKITYANGETWEFVGIFEVKDDKIIKETAYFAAPFEPADFRAPFANKV
jgi:hypothetical protein